MAAPADSGRALEARQIRELLLTGMHVHAAEFSAAVQSRHRLAGIEQQVFVEGGLHRMKRRKLGWPELHAHRIDFLDADTVLAGDCAADIDRKLKNFGAEALGSFELAG